MKWLNRLMAPNGQDEQYVEPAISFQDFRWACGHVGPAVCYQCWAAKLIECKELHARVKELEAFVTAEGECHVTDNHLKRLEVENNRLRSIIVMFQDSLNFPQCDETCGHCPKCVLSLANEQGDGDE